MLKHTFPDPNIIGQFRQFGELGPTYQIKKPLHPLDHKDWLLLIEVPETGETIEYRYSKIQKDPVAH